MENSMIEEPVRDEQPEPINHGVDCDCEICLICERSGCGCVCDEMPEFPEVNDMRDEYDEEAGI